MFRWSTVDNALLLAMHIAAVDIRPTAILRRSDGSKDRITCPDPGHGCQMARNEIPKRRRDFYCEHLDAGATETAARVVAAAESQKPEQEKRRE
jgi:hypothetical protein